jgi:hypothetical protein
MHRSSESIAALAAALAKAQSELSNPEKSLVATIGSDRLGEGARTFRYAPLSSGLDIVRKALGQQQIATVQTTAIDPGNGTINLTTLLVHASGEWIASDWPVCRLADTASPHRMGAALTYARRYVLFTLVGIAGEDDLDAPDLNGPPPWPTPGGNGNVDRALAKPPRPPGNAKPPRPILDPDSSAVMRDRLVREIATIGSAEEGAEWAYKALPAKNTLTASDARLVQLAFELRLSGLDAPTDSDQNEVQSSLQGADVRSGTKFSEHVAPASEPANTTRETDDGVLMLPKVRRYRDKAHLQFVASRPCLVCGRKPADPHHLRFAQVRALGRKVSDEFTVPLCRMHHREAHRAHNEPKWWSKLGIDAVATALGLWRMTRSTGEAVATAKTNSNGAPIESEVLEKVRVRRRTQRRGASEPVQASLGSA